MPLPADQRNGIINNYTVYYQKSSGGQVAEAFAKQLAALSLNISGLGIFTSYTLRVSASTPAGEGPQSAPISVITDENGQFVDMPHFLSNFVGGNRLTKTNGHGVLPISN